MISLGWMERNDISEGAEMVGGEEDREENEE
jgi:hypothetical protein